MTSETIILKNIKAIKTSIINEQVEKGKVLARRFFSICAESKGFDAPRFDLKKNQALLDDLLEFEKNICNLEFLYEFYGYISKMYLQTSNIEKAIMYGQSALELNRKINNLERVAAANNLLCNCVIADDTALAKAEYFKKDQYHLIDQIALLEEIPNHNAEKITKLLARKSRPSSYKYFNSKDSQHKEEMMRYTELFKRKHKEMH